MMQKQIQSRAEGKKIKKLNFSAWCKNVFFHQVWWQSAECYQLSAVPAVTVLSNNPQCFVNVSSSLPLELLGEFADGNRKKDQALDGRCASDSKKQAEL